MKPPAAAVLPSWPPAPLAAAPAGAPLVAAALAAVPAAVLARLAVGPLDRLLRRRHPARNWLGEEVTVAGGLAVAAGALGGLALLLAVAPATTGAPGGEAAAGPGGFGWRLLAACAAAALGGLWDDLAGGGGPRGLRAHLGALLQGRPGAGAFKAACLLLAGAVVAQPDLAAGRWAAAGATAAVVALAGNVANGLDVRPGRAAKALLLVGAVLAGAGAAAGAAGGPAAPGLLLVPCLAAVAAHLPLDLARRTMLGDTGANLLGVATGAVLAETLPGGGRGAALLVLACLQLLAETVSFSVLIGRSPLLRPLDLLGQRPPARGGGAGGHEPRPVVPFYPQGRRRIMGAASGPRGRAGGRADAGPRG